MAKTPFETLTKLEKINPKPSLQRRNSTGGAAIFSEPIPIPNYLRASIGSCHDLCKYGMRRDSPSIESKPRRNIYAKSEAKPTTNLRVKNIQESKNLNTNDRMKKASESYKNLNTNDRMKKASESYKNLNADVKKASESYKNHNADVKKASESYKNLGFPSPRRNPNKTLKSTYNPRAGRSDEVVKKRTSPLPRSHSPTTRPSSKIIPASKTRRTKSLPRKIGPAKPLERHERRKKTEVKTVVEEKIIQVVEAKDENQNEGLVSSPDLKQEMGSEANDSSPPTKAEEPEREEIVEREHEEEEDVSKERRVLRRALSEGDFENNKEKESTRIVVAIGKDKVKALVNAFETLITT